MRLATWSLLALASALLAPACSGKYVSTGAGPGEQQSQVIQCDDYLACDIETPCETGECLSIPGCSSAVCVSSVVVCDEACGVQGCAVADSYPGQLSSCPDGTPIKGQGQGVYPPSTGTGGGPAQGGTPGGIGNAPSGGYGSGGYATGGYATGGYAIGGYGATAGYGTAGTGYGNGVVDCQAYARCNGNVSCAGAGFECISIAGCALGICAPAAALCNSLCVGDCAILESYPLQLACSTGSIVGYESYPMGTGGASGYAGSPYGYAGEGSYAGYGGEP